MKHEINVTPLIDVMLVLLILFMVVTPLSQMGLDVELPATASADEPRPPVSPVLLEMNENGELSLNDKPLAREELSPLLREIFELRTDKSLFLKAHDKLPYREVVAVLDVARGSGVERVGIVPAPAE
jgi:biopolymer transport protein ExbD